MKKLLGIFAISALTITIGFSADYSTRDQINEGLKKVQEEKRSIGNDVGKRFYESTEKAVQRAAEGGDAHAAAKLDRVRHLSEKEKEFKRAKRTGKSVNFK